MASELLNNIFILFFVLLFYYGLDRIRYHCFYKITCNKCNITYDSLDLSHCCRCNKTYISYLGDSDRVGLRFFHCCKCNSEYDADCYKKHEC
jgi:hypothetical protein